MAKKKMDLDMIAMILVLVGGLNWGLAIWNINIVTSIANATAGIVEPIVYGLVGLSAVMIAYKKFIK